MGVIRSSSLTSINLDYIRNLIRVADEMREALASAVKGEASKKRDRLLAGLGPNPSHDEIIGANRSANAPD